MLHVSECFGGGVLEVVRELVERLPDYGIQSAIAYGRRDETPLSLASVFPPTVPAFELPWEGRSILAQLRARRALAQVIKHWRPDVIHLHSTFAGVVGALTGRGNVFTIYTPHGYSFLRTTHSRLGRGGIVFVERRIAARVDAVVGVSEHEALLARQTARAGTTFVVPNGISELDGLVLPPQPAPKGRPLVVAMGRIAPARLPSETAAILRSVASMADVLWIGGGSDSRLLAHVDRAGIERTGWVSRDGALAKLRLASVFVHWSAWDGLPLAILEAMALDVPVIGRDIPPVRELLAPEQLCTTVEGASRAIVALLSDPHRRAAALASQEASRRRYGASEMAASWAEVYRRTRSPLGVAQC